MIYKPLLISNSLYGSWLINKCHTVLNIYKTQISLICRGQTKKKKEKKLKVWGRIKKTIIMDQIQSKNMGSNFTMIIGLYLNNAIVFLICQIQQPLGQNFLSFEPFKVLNSLNSLKQFSIFAQDDLPGDRLCETIATLLPLQQKGTEKIH